MRFIHLPAKNGHIDRHFVKAGIGSQFLPMSEGEKAVLFKRIDDAAYASWLEDPDSPTRRILTLTFDKPIGTTSLVRRSDLPDGAVVFPLLRDPGTKQATIVPVTLVDEKPPSYQVLVAFGPVGKGALAVVTAFPGLIPLPTLNGVPFDERAGLMETWWGEHAFMATPDDLQVALEALHAVGNHDYDDQVSAALGAAPGPRR